MITATVTLPLSALVAVRESLTVELHRQRNLRLAAHYESDKAIHTLAIDSIRTALDAVFDAYDAARVREMDELGQAEFFRACAERDAIRDAISA